MSTQNNYESFPSHEDYIESQYGGQKAKNIYTDEAREFDNKVRLLLNNPSDMVNYYDFPDTTEDINNDMWIQAVERAIMSDGYDSNTSWLMTLDLSQLEEYASLDPVTKNYLHNYSRHLDYEKTTYDTLKTQAKRRDVFSRSGGYNETLRLNMERGGLSQEAIDAWMEEIEKKPKWRDIFDAETVWEDFQEDEIVGAYELLGLNKEFVEEQVLPEHIVDAQRGIVKPYGVENALANERHMTWLYERGAITEQQWKDSQQETQEYVQKHSGDVSEARSRAAYKAGGAALFPDREGDVHKTFQDLRYWMKNATHIITQGTFYRAAIKEEMHAKDIPWSDAASNVLAYSQEHGQINPEDFNNFQNVQGPDNLFRFSMGRFIAEQRQKNIDSKRTNLGNEIQKADITVERAIGIVSWEELKETDPELASQYIAHADGNEELARQRHALAYRQIPGVAQAASLFTSEQEATLLHMLDEAETEPGVWDYDMGQAFLDKLGWWNKHTAGAFFSGLTILLTDEDIREAMIENFSSEELRKEIRKSDYSAAQALGLENTFLGMILDLTGAITFDPLVWLFTPAAGVSFTNGVRTMSSAANIKVMTNSHIGKRIIKDLWTQGVAFHQGKSSSKAYWALFNDFDMETQIALKTLFKDAVAKGKSLEKGVPELFSKAIETAILNGQTPGNLYKSQWNIARGNFVRKVLNDYGKVAFGPSTIKKLESFFTPQLMMKNVSIAGPEDIPNLVNNFAHMLGSMSEISKADEAKIFDDFLDNMFEILGVTKDKGIGRKLEEAQKTRAQIVALQDYLRLLEGQHGFGSRTIIDDLILGEASPLIERGAKARVAEKLSKDTEKINGHIAKNQKRLDKVNENIAQAENVIVRIEKLEDINKGPLSKSQKDTIRAQKTRIKQEAENKKRIQERIDSLNKQYDDVLKKADLESKDLYAVEDVDDALSEGFLSEKALKSRLEDLKKQKKATQKKIKELEGSDDYASSEKGKYFTKLQESLDEDIKELEKITKEISKLQEKKQFFEAKKGFLKKLHDKSRTNPKGAAIYETTERQISMLKKQAQELERIIDKKSQKIELKMREPQERVYTRRDAETGTAIKEVDYTEGFDWPATYQNRVDAGDFQLLEEDLVKLDEEIRFTNELLDDDSLYKFLREKEIDTPVGGQGQPASETIEKLEIPYANTAKNIDEIGEGRKGKFMQDMLEEGTRFDDAPRADAYKAMLERKIRLEKRLAESKESTLGQFTGQGGKPFIRDAYNIYRREHRVINRLLGMKLNKLNSLHSYSPRREVQQLYVKALEGIARKSKWHNVKEWQGGHFRIIKAPSKGKPVQLEKISLDDVEKLKKTKVEGSKQTLYQQQVNAEKIVHIPPVAELLPKGGYRVNWRSLRFHMRFEQDNVGMVEAFLRAGNIKKGVISHQQRALAKANSEFADMIKNQYFNPHFRRHSGNVVDDISDEMAVNLANRNANEALRTRQQTVDVDLPISNMDLILADKIAQGLLSGKINESSKWSKFFRHQASRTVIEWSERMHNIWILDKLFKLSTGITAGADELLFFNSVFGWGAGAYGRALNPMMQGKALKHGQGLWIQDMMSRGSNWNGRRALNKISKLKEGEKISDKDAAKIERLYERLLKQQESVPQSIESRLKWLESQFAEGDLIFLSPKDPNYFLHLKSTVNGYMEDLGFQAFANAHLSKNKQIFYDWFDKSPEALYLKNYTHQTLRAENGQIISAHAMSADDYYVKYDSIRHLLFSKEVLENDALYVHWEQFLRAATQRAKGVKDALPPTSTMKRIQVYGRQPQQSAQLNFPLRTITQKDSPFMEQLFAQPAHYRTSLITKTVFEQEKQRLIALYKSQGIKVLKRTEYEGKLGKAAAYDIRFQNDMFGASWFDNQLARSGKGSFIPEGYIEAKAAKKAAEAVDDMMMSFHMSTKTGKKARWIMPFGKPYWDFQMRYFRDLTRRAQLRGNWGLIDGSMEGASAIRRGIENVTHYLPEPRRFSYYSRMANADLEFETKGGKDVNFSPFFFLPTGSAANIFWIALPGLGVVPLAGLAVLLKGFDTVKPGVEEAMETLFPSLYFVPDFEMETFGSDTFDFLAGGGFSDSLLRFMTSGLMPVLGQDPDPRSLFEDPVQGQVFARHTRDIYFDEIPIYLNLLEDTNNLPDVMSTIQSQANAALTDAVQTFWADEGLEWSVPGGFKMNADYIDTAQNWIDWTNDNGVLIDWVDDSELMDEYNNNPRSDEVRRKMQTRIADYWFSELNDAERTSFILQDPRILALVVGGYVVTADGQQYDALEKDQGRAYRLGETYRPNKDPVFSSDQERQEKFKEYLDRGWIRPRHPEQTLQIIVGLYANARANAAGEIYKDFVHQQHLNLVDVLERKHNIVPENFLLDDPEKLREWLQEELSSLYPGSAEFRVLPTSLSLYTSDNIMYENAQTFEYDKTTGEIQFGIPQYYDLTDFSDAGRELLKVTGIEDEFGGVRLTGRELFRFLVRDQNEAKFTNLHILTKDYVENYTDTMSPKQIEGVQYLMNLVYSKNPNYPDQNDYDWLEAIIPKIQEARELWENNEGQLANNDEFQDLAQEIMTSYQNNAHVMGDMLDGRNNVIQWNDFWEYYFQPWIGSLNWTPPNPPGTKTDSLPKTVLWDDLDLGDEYDTSYQFQTMVSNKPDNAYKLRGGGFTIQVNDGDTLTAQTPNGDSHAIRIIGIMANELTSTDPYKLSEAHRQMEFLEEILEVGEGRVFYVLDDRFGNKYNKDPYDRYVGWLWIAGGLDGSLPVGQGEYIFFEDHFRPTDTYYRKDLDAEELPFRDSWNLEYPDSVAEEGELGWYTEGLKRYDK